MNRNHDPIVKATVIIVACIVATIMICVECALLPRYGWLWLVLLGLIATAIIFCVVTIVLAWRHGKEEDDERQDQMLVRSRDGAHRAHGAHGHRRHAGDPTVRRGHRSGILPRPARGTGHRPGRRRLQGHGNSVEKPWKEYGDTIPILPEAIWIEAMGYDDRPDSDDCIIAVDLGTGDFCYDRILAENPQARAGAVICLDKISEFIRTRTSVDGMGQ